MVNNPRAQQASLWGPEADPSLDPNPLPLPTGNLELGRPGHPVFLGTSGFSFEDWTGPFYPKGLASGERLAFYAQYFPCVEINSSYYGIPKPAIMQKLVDKTKPGFEFVVKANQEMTHKSQAAAGTYQAFNHCLEPMIEAGRLSGVLAQFPWRFRNGPTEREQILTIQRQLCKTPLFVEFRHDSWMKPDIFRFLDDHQIGYCSVDEPTLDGLVPPLARLTGSLAYVRFHGRNKQTWWGKGEGDRYDYNYQPEELREWLSKIRELAERAEKTYVFFNNCHVGQAARNARLMMDLLQKELGVSG